MTFNIFNVHDRQHLLPLTRRGYGSNTVLLSDVVTSEIDNKPPEWTDRRTVLYTGQGSVEECNKSGIQRLQDDIRR